MRVHSAGEVGAELVGLVAGQMPLGGEPVNRSVTIACCIVVERLIGCKMDALHGKSPFRWCAALAALCLCDGLIIPRLWRQHNIGKIHKMKSLKMCNML